MKIHIQYNMILNVFVSYIQKENILLEDISAFFILSI